MPARPPRYVLLAASLLALSGCGGSTKTVTATTVTPAATTAPAPRYAPGRYSSTYPKSFAATLTHDCLSEGASTAMCQCAVQGIQNATNYVRLVQEAPAIVNGTKSSPNWFNDLQTACKRRGPGSPAYVPPIALGFLDAHEFCLAADNDYLKLERAVGKLSGTSLSRTSLVMADAGTYASDLSILGSFASPDQRAQVDHYAHVMSDLVQQGLQNEAAGYEGVPAAWTGVAQRIAPIPNLVNAICHTEVASAPAPPAKTVTATPAAPAPPPASSSSFSGNGTKSLGTISVPSASTLEWACPGCSAFEVSNNPNDSGTIGIASNARRGTSAVDAGTYHDVQVISDGNWTIKIVPG